MVQPMHRFNLWSGGPISWHLCAIRSCNTHTYPAEIAGNYHSTKEGWQHAPWYQLSYTTDHIHLDWVLLRLRLVPTFLVMVQGNLRHYLFQNSKLFCVGVLRFSMLLELQKHELEWAWASSHSRASAPRTSMDTSTVESDFSRWQRHTCFKLKVRKYSSKSNQLWLFL